MLTWYGPSSIWLSSPPMKKHRVYNAISNSGLTPTKVLDTAFKTPFHSNWIVSNWVSESGCNLVYIILSKSEQDKNSYSRMAGFEKKIYIYDEMMLKVQFLPHGAAKIGKPFFTIN